jgi:aspartate/methionine/tyrosine aminotransferase
MENPAEPAATATPAEPATPVGPATPFASGPADGALPPLGRQVGQIPPSGIRALANAAWATPGAIHLEFGEPDWPTPPNIVAAADRAARDGLTRYAPSQGVPRLREAVCAKLVRDNGWDGVTPDRVVVTPGGVGGLYCAYRAVLDPGDEILVPDPGWPNLASIALTVDARPVRYRLDERTGGFAGTAALDAALTARTRAIVINTPSNPTGAVFSAADQAALGDWATAHGLWVIADECYDQLWFDRPNTTFAIAAPHAPAITVFSLSKTYAMTGWRVGYTVGTPAAAARMSRVVETMGSSVNTVAQWAAVEALDGPQLAVARMRDAYRERRDAAVAAAGRLGLAHAVPAGAFYLWLGLPAAVTDPSRFALDLLAATGVALAPGDAFGAGGRGHARVSLAASGTDIVRGLRATADYLASEGTA